MNTSQPEGRRTGCFASRTAGVFHVALLILTILALAGAAAGIVIGFPQALEIVAVQAHASVAMGADEHLPWLEDDDNDENEPFVGDDISSAAAVYATARAGARAGSALEAAAAR